LRHQTKKIPMLRKVSLPAVVMPSAGARPGAVDTEPREFADRAVRAIAVPD
jgi:hypothetical protein